MTQLVYVCFVVSNTLARWEYTITPCDTVNAFGGIIFCRNVTNSANNGIGGGT